MLGSSTRFTVSDAGPSHGLAHLRRHAVVWLGPLACVGGLLLGPLHSPVAAQTLSEEPATEQEPAGHGTMPAPALAVNLRGFGDAGWSATKTPGAPATSTFALGQLDFFPTARISDEVSFLAEIVIEAGQTNEPKVDLERLLVRYAPLDSVAVSVGRYHTAIGFYNTAYHHSSLMQTTIGRPLLFAFEDEGGILPIHDVGVSVSGSVTRLGARWEYTTEVGNGRASNPYGAEPVQGTLDDNAAKAVGFSLSARPTRAKNASLGISLRTDRFTPAGTDPIRELLLGTHVVYQTPRVEFLAEGVVLHHTPKGGATLTSTGGYVQASYRSGVLTPYARYEMIDPDDQDPYFARTSWQRGPLAGVRWDVANMAALKVEITHRRFVQGMTANTIQANLSFGF